jgi:hypothetical protein
MSCPARRPIGKVERHFAIQQLLGLSSTQQHPMENQVDTKDLSSEDIMHFLHHLRVSPVVINIILSGLDTSRSTLCKLLGNPFFHRRSQHTSYTNLVADIRERKASMLSLPEVSEYLTTCRLLPRAHSLIFDDLIARQYVWRS